jgi:lysophospholipase L1-like esterase
MRKLSLLVTTELLFIALLAPTAEAAPPLPKRMAAIGDSITRAANVCCWYGDRPRHSWSTGGASSDGIRSHYERILAAQPAIQGHNYNNARSGARMSDAPAQASRAVDQEARYVTILMGANDVCTSSPSAMTSPASFRADFESAMQVLDSGLSRNARIFVSSIPNIYRLWEVLHTKWLARAMWSTFDICQSMLDSGRTEAQRQAVLDRERVFNQILADVCSRYARCRFDGNAVFNYQFTADMVSTLDYFHPDREGQAVLARVTWARSWWATP